MHRRGPKILGASPLSLSILMQILAVEVDGGDGGGDSGGGGADTAVASPLPVPSSIFA